MCRSSLRPCSLLGIYQVTAIMQCVLFVVVEELHSWAVMCFSVIKELECSLVCSNNLCGSGVYCRQD